MQPYFFPYIEYFRLISRCDLWIAFDTVKYNKRSWMGRNRIINRDKGWSYINIPVSKQPFDTELKDTIIDDSFDWRGSFFDKLRVYKNEAPNYDTVVGIAKEILDQPHPRLATLNLSGLTRICRYLDIDVDLKNLSEMSLTLPEQCAPGEWALQICKALGADQYLNASGGRDLFDPAAFRREGIELLFHDHAALHYETRGFDFVPDLSIIDPMMWVDVQTLQDLVHCAPITNGET